MGLERLKQFGGTDHPYPEISGKYGGPAVVVSSGWSVWDDLDKAGFQKPNWQQNFGVIAVNDVGMHLPCKIDHWYSNDTHWLLKWMAARRPEYQKRDEKIYSHSCFNEGLVDCWWPWPGNGTSSIGAVFTALALGYDEILVCGVPMDEKGHYFDPPWTHTNFQNPGTGGHRIWERAFREIFEGRVKVMSGTLCNV